MRTPAVLALLTSSAGADGITVRVPERWQDTGPALHLDDVRPFASEGPAPTWDSKTTIVELGPLARLVAEGDWWSSMQSPDLTDARDVDTRGWRASFELSHDFGLFRVGAHFSAGHVDGRFEHADYRAVGLSIYRTFHLSRWMTAWIALTGGVQQFTGQPQSASLMLSIGTTFR